MTPDESKVLGEKVANGTATREEELLFLKDLNGSIERMRGILAKHKIA